MDDCGSGKKRVPLDKSDEEPVKRRQGTDNMPIQADLTINENDKSVFVLSNVSPEATVEDMDYLLSPFAKSNSFRVMLCANTRSALVEAPLQDCIRTFFFDQSPEQASTTMEYINAHSPSIRGCPLKASYPDKNVKSSPQEMRVLLVTVMNLRFPVDIETFYRLFSVYGVVEKIITFSKPAARFQALLQFFDARQARDALAALNNKFLYENCNQLQIQTSKLTELTVRTNNAKSWDFTQSPWKGSTQHASPGGHEFLDQHQMLQRVNPTPPLNVHQQEMPPSLVPSSAGTALWNGHGIFPHSMPTSAPLSHLDYNSHLIGSNQTSLSSGLSSRLFSPDVRDKLPRELQNPAALQQINPTNSCVVICYNLPAEEISVEKLFNLLSLYGIVNRIKVLRDKPNTALAQYSDPLYATLACHFLARRSYVQNAPFFGSGGNFQIGISKKAEVKLPSRMSADSEEAKRTMAFTLRDQRCGADEIEKFIRGACKPTATLFIANIHESVTEEELRQILSTAGTITKLRLRPLKEASKKFTAMAEMASEKEALSAICHLHNARLGDSNIKLAFSKQIMTSATMQSPVRT